MVEVARSMTARRPTIRDVAREAGVSVTLTSFALNGRSGIAQVTRARVLEVAERLGYSADPLARELRTGTSSLYGLVVRNVRNPFFADIISGAQERAAQIGSTVLLIDSAYDVARERLAITELAARRVAGLAIAPVGPGESIRAWQELRPGTPVVVINADADFGPECTRVTPDNRTAVRSAVRHLLSRGHRRITFLTAPRELVADHDRLEHFLAVCDELGVEADPVETELEFDAVQALVVRLLGGPRRPTAVVTNSDHTAYAVYAGAREAGYVVGRDIAVVGHDDLPTSSLVDPPLTTVRVDRLALGRAVFDRLLRGPASGDHVADVELVVRSSTPHRVPPSTGAPDA
jgi:LacI family transcriptional regulator